MTYASRESSIYSGKPIEFYRFVRGTDAWYFTNANVDTVFNGITYEAKNVSRGDVQQTEEVSAADVEFTLPDDDPLVAAILNDVGPGVPILCTFFRNHVGELATEARTFFVGTVVNLTIQGDEAQLQCSSAQFDFENPVTRIYYQRSCPFILYEPNTCGVDKAAFTVNATVSAVSTDRKQITLSGVGNIGAGSKYYENGIVRFDGQDRFVTRQETDVIYLHVPFPAGPIVGQTVSVSAGCDHSVETCETRFSNEERFGGFPLIPLRSPWQRLT